MQGKLIGSGALLVVLMVGTACEEKKGEPAKDGAVATAPSTDGTPPATDAPAQGGGAPAQAPSAVKPQDETKAATPPTKEDLAAFTSVSGPAFYGLPISEQTLTLVRQPAALPPPVMVEGSALRSFDPEIPLRWSVVG